MLRKSITGLLLLVGRVKTIIPLSIEATRLFADLQSMQESLTMSKEDVGLYL